MSNNHYVLTPYKVMNSGDRVITISSGGLVKSDGYLVGNIQKDAKLYYNNDYISGKLNKATFWSKLLYVDGDSSKPAEVGDVAILAENDEECYIGCRVVYVDQKIDSDTVYVGDVLEPDSPTYEAYIDDLVYLW